MSRFGSRRSDEDVSEWPELKARPRTDEIAVVIAELNRKVDALIVELQAKGVIARVAAPGAERPE